MKVKLTYFKSWNGPNDLGGKYYSEGEYESSALHMWKIIDEVEKIRREKCLPGLVPGHSSFHVLISTEPETSLHLLIAEEFLNSRKK